MSNEYLTFLTFNNEQQALNTILFLEENQIDVELENERKYFDISYSFNKFNADIKLKIKGQEFEKANGIIDDYFQKQIHLIDNDYFIYKFTNEELIEVVKNKDNWGHLNYLLAKDLLSKNNIIIPDNLLEEHHQKNIQTKSIPKNASTFLLLLGYTSSILIYALPILPLFALAIIIGGFFAFLTKTLSNGQSVFYFSNTTKQHGYFILILVSVSFVWWFFGGWIIFDYN